MGSEPPNKKIRKLNDTSITMDSSQPPLIIKDIGDLKENTNELNALLKKWFSEINVNEIKFTNNNNLLIFPKEVSDYDKLIKLNINYKGKKIEELAPKGIDLVLKGINFEKANRHLDFLKSEGIYGVRKITRSLHPEYKLNKIRIICENNEVADRLRHNGIFLNWQRLRVEEFKKSIKITQCFKCQKLGHIAINCKKLKKVCVKCGDEDHETDTEGKLICHAIKNNCVLCGEEHSSAYSKCKIKMAKLTEKKEFSKSYSSVTKGFEQNDNLKDFLKNSLEQIENNITQKIEQINDKINNVEMLVNAQIVKIENIMTSVKNNQNQIESLKTNINSLKEEYKSIYNKITISFVDFFYINNPKTHYDEATIKSLTTFINTFGQTKDTNFVRNRLHSVVAKKK